MQAGASIDRFGNRTIFSILLCSAYTENLTLLKQAMIISEQDLINSPTSIFCSLSFSFVLFQGRSTVSTIAYPFAAQYKWC